MDPAVITLCVLAVAAFLFVTELIPLAVTAMAACTALGILGVLPSKQVYAGLSNSTVVLFGGMFVIGAAMFKTGLAEAIGIAVVKKAGTNQVPLMAAIMLVTIVLSSVSSNTGTVACLMPVIIGICQAAKISPSKELMPLAIAANVGGTITMIGTPPNVIVTGALSAAGLPTFGFFEFAYLIKRTFIMLICSLAYLNGQAAIEPPASAKKRSERSSQPAKVAVSSDILHPELYNSIKRWRYELATEKELPPYTILQQKALLGIVNTLPTNSRELLAIPGIGKKIIENYGSILLGLVKEYTKKQE